MDSVKSYYSQITGGITNSSLCPELDLKTRIIGFVLSFIIGVFMLILSLSQLFTIALGGARIFAMWYTAGNVVCLSSSFFLMGPKKQCELMLNPVRATVSFVMIGCMISCLVLALLGFSKIIILIIVCVQFCAVIWYVLSYIPGGQGLCKSCLKGVVGRASNSLKETEMV